MRKPLGFIGVCAALLAVHVYSKPTCAMGMEGLYWVDFGVGFPQLGSLELALAPLKKWQFGISYGLIPGGGRGGSISPSYVLPSQNVTLSSGAHVTIHEPTVTATFNSLCPFVRFFPAHPGFYLQLTWAMMRINNQLTSELYDVVGNKIPGASYGGDVDVTQVFPTISMGHIFIQKMFFFSVNMGVSVVGSISSNINLLGQLPDSLGGNSSNEAAMAEVNTQNTALINQASDEFKRQVQALPSVQLLFGISF